MEQILKDHLIREMKLEDDAWTHFSYSEDVNPDALSEAWLDSSTSYIYKVGVLIAVDANKLDWAYIVIGSQRDEFSPVQVIGILHFEEGENDDMARTINRATRLLCRMNAAFENLNANP